MDSEHAKCRNQVDELETYLHTVYHYNDWVAMTADLRAAVERRPYLRWEPAVSDTGTFRGDSLELLNRRTLELLHENAVKETTRRKGEAHG